MYCWQFLNVLGGRKTQVSILDLRTKFKQEYPSDQLISIPVAKLQDYRSVPVHVTEDDVRANIKLELEETLQERTPLINAERQEILRILNSDILNALEALSNKFLYT